jgi:hypothetical protein
MSASMSVILVVATGGASLVLALGNAERCPGAQAGPGGAATIITGTAGALTPARIELAGHQRLFHSEHWT